MDLQKGKAIAVGVIFGSVSCILLLMLFALSFIKMGKLPHDVIGTIVVLCASISSFFSAYISVRILREKGLLYGMITGFALFLIVFFLSVITSGEHLTLFTLFKGLSMVLSGAIGGIISVNKRVRVR